jgi:CIC family chloride channel protein
VTEAPDTLKEATLKETTLKEAGGPGRFAAPAALRVVLAAPQDLNARLRALLRTSELALVLLAIAVGGAAGVLVSLMAETSQILHSLLFGIPLDVRLSATDEIAPFRALVAPVAGGLIVALIEMARRLYNRGVAVDPIEANALRGGRMSLRDSIIVTLQTLVSNGFGASVGLEAGYTQISSGVASRLGMNLNLRRSDLRILVGCAAAGAIAAAFGAPLTGAFYAFELIIGVYSVANVTAVMAGSIAGFTSAAAFAPLTNGAPYSIHAPAIGGIHPIHYLVLVGLGLVTSVVAIAVMRLVAMVEQGFEWSRTPAWARPAVGGLMIGLLALVTPQVLAAGHGAMKLDLQLDLAPKFLLGLIILKLIAAMISLGSGFRGGLFFASLFVGCLIGKLFGLAEAAVFPDIALDPMACVLTGMGAFAVGIVGGPLTMSFLVLETTGDYGLTGAVLATCVATSLTVREMFGYSFSTWRLHLRGETIRSANDVSWMRNLTVKRLMRTDVAIAPGAMTVAEFRRTHPLGGRHMVVAVDEHGAYQGLVPTAEAYSQELDARAETTRILDLATHTDMALLPDMNVKTAMDTFERAEAETLAVVADEQSRRVVGLLTEAYATRRYAEELDQANRTLSGETR